MTPGAAPSRDGLVAATLAFAVLNALLTFENRWPGFGVRLAPQLSIELCLAVLTMAAWIAWRGLPRARTMTGLACAFAGLVAVRYVDVTVPAVFGRPVNLYWDGRHAVEVAQLALDAEPAWRLVLGTCAVVAGFGLVVLVARRAIDAIARTLTSHRPRPWVFAAGACLSASYAVHPYVDRDTRWFFSMPVSATIAHQAALLPAAFAPERVDAALAASARFDDRDVGALKGADVLVLFAEAYGAVTFDDPDAADALAGPRARLAAALEASGRAVVSARVRSPTFGGSSWLAHAALLAGVDTHDPLVHDLLLTTTRPTLVSHFARHGYRTVGWMPGLQKPWPEGTFYRYERLADARGVGYAGPEFGFWRVPDQASAALLAAQEFDRRASDARPRFVVFPTVTTHAPFRPVAPLHDDWTRLVRADAYAPEEAAQALAQPVSWKAPGAAYRQSMTYMFGWLGAWLETRAPRDLVVVVIGDHQPIASVTGPRATWDVPVHVIASDPALLRRFVAAGFVDGLVPPATSLAPMHELTPTLVAAFDAQMRCASTSPEGASSGSAASQARIASASSPLGCTSRSRSPTDQL